MSDLVNENESCNTQESDLTRRDVLKLTGASALALTGGLTLSVGKAYSRPNNKKIRIAVVGGGFGSSFYWHEHPDCVVAGVTDLRSDRREKLKKVYGCDQVYDSLEEMISKAKDIDAVAIFTEATNHVKHARMCLDNGWHVISAVPACFTLEEADILKETVERTGLTYMMAETSYYRQDAIMVREMFKKGIFGNVFYSELEYYHDRGDLETIVSNKKTRFYKQDGTPSWRWGLPPMHYPTHSLGLLTGITGERIVRVSCLGWGDGKHPMLTSNDYNNPFWNESALMQTNKGNMTRCNVFWLCAAHGERAQWLGDKASYYMPKGHIHGAKLNYRTKGETVSYLDLPTQGGGDIKVPLFWKTDMLPEAMRHQSGHGGSHTFITAEFINALLEERNPSIDLYNSLAMTVPGIVAHQSALKNGEQLEVPQYDNSHSQKKG